MDNATLMSCMDTMSFDVIGHTDLECSYEKENDRVCDCADGPIEVLDPKSNQKNCRVCGKVLSMVAVSVDPTTTMKWRADGSRYSCAQHNDVQLGTRISGYGQLTQVQKWTTDKSRRPLHAKLNNIRQVCEQQKPPVPRNIINVAWRIFKELDQYLQKKNEIHRAGRLIGLEAACVKQAVHECKWLCSDDEIMRMFFLRQTRSKRTNEHDTIILEETRQYLTFGMEQLYKALKYNKQNNCNKTSTKPLTTSENRIRTVQVFIELGCKKLKMNDQIAYAAKYLANRLNERYLSHIIQSRQNETIYIACIIMANERFGTKTTNHILNTLGSTSSTITKLKNDIRKYLERKFQINTQVSRRKKCNAKDKIFDSLFPNEEDLHHHNTLT